MDRREIDYFSSKSINSAVKKVADHGSQDERSRTYQLYYESPMQNN